MQLYNQGFASAYNRLRWASFARRVAPSIREVYESASDGNIQKTALDLCCGTGQLAATLLEHDYSVVGVDFSDHMLHYAKLNAEPYIASGKASFIQADVTELTIDQTFGLVVSTFDALGHVPTNEQLANTFQRVFPICNKMFLFDLSTRLGLKSWNGTHIEDTDDGLIVNIGIYDDQNNRAILRFSGIVRNNEGVYERFSQVVQNTVFETQWIQDTLFAIGWKDVYFAKLPDLKTPLTDPEAEARVFVVATK